MIKVELIKKDSFKDPRSSYCVLVDDEQLLDIDLSFLKTEFIFVIL